MPVDPFLKIFKRIIDNHPQFYTHDLNENDLELTYTAYRGHHPLNTTTNTYRKLPYDTETVRWSDDSNPEQLTDDPDKLILAKKGYISENYSDGTPTVLANIDKIESEFPDFLDQLSTNYNVLQFLGFSGNNGMVSRDTQEALHEQFGTYYNALKASPEELKQVTGMAERRSEYFLNPDNTPSDKPNWAALTHCPVCDEQFWSTIDEENKPSIDSIQHRTYCPVCDHAPIPTSHIMDPVEFTDENVLD